MIFLHTSPHGHLTVGFGLRRRAWVASKTWREQLCLHLHIRRMFASLVGARGSVMTSVRNEAKRDDVLWAAR